MDQKLLKSMVIQNYLQGPDFEKLALEKNQCYPKKSKFYRLICRDLDVI